MEKEKLMQKLKMIDYNKELEEILASKPFPKNVKNLLSSMLYKIENSYEDYKKVKVDVPTKKELLEELIKIIAVDCDEIEIIKPRTEGKKSIAIKRNQKILTYQNELALMQGIYELHNKNNENKNDELKDKAFELMLQEGQKNSKIEVIRDFDGWSWNVMIGDIENYIPNTIYQCLICLVGYETIGKNIKIQELEDLIKEKYKSTLADKIIKVILQLSIIEYIKERPEEGEKLENTEEQLKAELELMENKKIYVEGITKQKKEYIKEIENIDKYINDDLKLKKEYIKQNERLPQEKRVFSLSDFSEKIESKRKILETQIKLLTEKLKPENYIEERNKLENNIKFILSLDVENEEKLLTDIIDLTLKAMNIQIEKIETKKEVKDKIYVLRYFKLMNIDKEKKVGDLRKKQFEQTEKILITTGCNLKALTIFSQNIEENYRIYKNIFNTKIIDLESAYIEINKENMVQIYDDNSLEKEEKITEIKELSVKQDKKIKIFI